MSTACVFHDSDPPNTRNAGTTVSPRPMADSVVVSDLSNTLRNFGLRNGL